MVPWVQMLLDVDMSRHNEVADLHWEVNRLNKRVRELESRSAILDTNLIVQEDALNHFIEAHWLPLQIMLIHLHERLPLPCSHCAERVEGRTSPVLPVRNLLLLTNLNFIFQPNSLTFIHLSLFSHDHSSSKQDKTIHLATQVHGDIKA